MESKVENKKPKPKVKKKTAVTADNPGRINGRPTSHLSREHLYQLQIKTLELEKVRLEMDNLTRQIDSNLKTNEILRVKLREKKGVEQSIKNEHIKFIEKIKDETGIDLKGKSLDYITGEVLSDEELGAGG